MEYSSPQVEAAADTSRFIPDDICCSDQIFDLDFNPQTDFLAVGIITGDVSIYKYQTDQNHNKTTSNLHVFDIKHHKSACRGLKFTEDGQKLYTISSDMSWALHDGCGEVVLSMPNAHGSPINKLQIIDYNQLATGDDSGIVKLWDVRTGTTIVTFRKHNDYVSSFNYTESQHTLISTAGDATLCVYDLRNHQNIVQSDEQESEMTCLVCLHNGRKVVAGTQDGVILIYGWGKWGDCNDRFLGHPQNVDSMIKIDESTIFTGSSDGLIRVVSVLPNKILGVIGDHDGFPVEGIQKDRDSSLLASFAHDEIIRFWDISHFLKNMKSVTLSENCDDSSNDDESNVWCSMSEDGLNSNSSSDEDDAASETSQSRYFFPTPTQKFYSNL